MLKTKITPLYERLSRDDEKTGDKLRQLPTIEANIRHSDICGPSTDCPCDRKGFSLLPHRKSLRLQIYCQ